MAYKIRTIIWHSMMGLVNPDKLMKAHFLQNGYSEEKEYVIYPNGIFTAAKKEIVTNNGERISINVRISTRGYLIWQFELQFQDNEYRDMTELKFSISDLNIEDKSIFEIQVSLVYELFEGMSVIEIYKESLLKTSAFTNLMDKLGVTYFHNQIHLSFFGYYVTTEKDSFEMLKSKHQKSNLDLFEGMEISNLENIKIRGIESQIYFGDSVVIYTTPEEMELIQQIHLGFNHFSTAMGLIYNLLDLEDTKLFQLLEYINSEDNISWIYVQETLSDIEFNFLNIIHQLEYNYTGYMNFKGKNFQDPFFIQTLIPMYDIELGQQRYSEIKAQIEQKRRIISDTLRDKGDKEEQEANNSLIQLIGLLAVLEIISEFLPILPEPFPFWVRLTALVVIFPLLGVVWYRSQLGSRKRMKYARSLKEKNQLLSLQKNIESLRLQILQQSKSSSGPYLRDLYKRELKSLDDTLVEIKEQLTYME